MICKRNFIYSMVIFFMVMSSLLFSQAAGDSTNDPIIGTIRLVPATGLAGTPQGSPEPEPGHSPNEDQFIHILTRNLWVMETEVTQQMWKELQVLQPDIPPVASGFTRNNRPVENVTWNQAILFANLLSLENGLTRCYYTDPGFTIPIDAGNYTGEEFKEVYCDFNAEGYRLPTEGEWEYFTRAGTDAPFAMAEFGDQYGALSSCIPGALPSLETAAWYCANSDNTTHLVGTKIANSWNLKDLHGNVSEWCWDWWDFYPVGTQTDYQGPASGVTRVIRGGNWKDKPSSLRSAGRSSFSPDLGSETIGFRMVRTLGMSINSPRGGEKSRMGTTQRIAWTPGSMTGEVTVSLYKGEMFESIIGTTPIEKGNLSWTIPQEQTPESDYRIRIYQGDIQAYSPGDFSITASETYTVTFQTDGTPGATLIGTTPQTVDEGGNCTEVIANEPTGYHFVNWTGTGGFTTTDNPLTVTNVTADMTITANFAINTYTVTFQTDGTPGATLTGTTPQTVNHGANCTPVTANVSAECKFVAWTGIGGFVTTTANPLTVTNVTQNMTITANYVILYTVTFQVETGGASNGRGGGALVGNSTQTVDHGGNCTAVEAVPNAGYAFINWTGPGGFTSTDNPLTVTNVTAEMAFTAHFVANTFTVTFQPGTGGSLSGSTSQTVNYGGNCTAVTAVPGANYHFLNWTGTGGFATTTANPLTVTNVTSNMTVNANFSNMLSVNFKAKANGTLTGDTEQEVPYGSNCTAVEAFPGTGYHFVDWTGTGGFVTTDNPLTVTNVTAGMEITANFAINTYSVTFTAGANGVVNGTLSQAVDHGSNCTPVMAVPNENYHFVNWAGTGGFVSSNNPLIVGKITGDMTIAANFAINTYTVKFMSGTGGTISGTTSQEIPHGGNCTAVTAVPNTGYTWGNWTGTGGFVTTTDNPLTVTNVTANMTITANFTANTYTVNFTPGTGGTLTGNLSQTVAHGGNCTAVTAVPNTGKSFVNWTGTNGFVTTTANPLTVSNVTANMTITANFAVSTFKVTFQVLAQDLASGRGGGTLNGLTTQVVNYGGNCSAVTAVPGAKYNFVNWTGTGGFVTTTTNPLTITNVTSNMVITANFVLKKCILTFQSGAGGTLSGVISQEVDYNGTGTPVIAVPNTGYIFVNWTGTGGFTSPDNPLSVKNVTINMTITANFKQGTPSGS